MRVLLVSSHGDDVTFGGAERYVADLGRGLRTRGHEVSVISAFPVQNSASVGHTLTLHQTDWRSDPLRRLRNHAGDLVSRPGGGLAGAVASSNADLIHTSNLPGISTAAWEIGRRLGVPVVHTLHDYYLLCPRVTLERRDGRACRPHPLLCGMRTRRLVRWAPAVSHVVAGSEHLLRAHDGLFRAAETHVIRLPMSPTADRLPRPLRIAPRTIGYLGALERSKGVEVLLDAAPALARLGFHIRMAGEGRLREAVGGAAGPGLEYVGRVTGAEKTAFLESVDLAVVPSLWAEPSGPPYTVLEWLAAGRPVLCSLRGGLAESQSLPGVVGIEPTVEGLVAGASQLADAWQEVVARLSPVEHTGDVERWLDEHEAVYMRAARRRSTSS